MKHHNHSLESLHHVFSLFILSDELDIVVRQLLALAHKLIAVLRRARQRFAIFAYLLLLPAVLLPCAFQSPALIRELLLSIAGLLLPIINIDAAHGWRSGIALGVCLVYLVEN